MIDRKIIISNGWEPDQNNALAEVVIPSTINTLNAPRKITFLGQMLNWIPSNASTLQEIELSNMTTIAYTNGAAFTLNKYTALHTFRAPKLLSLSGNTSGSAGGNFLRDCTALTTIEMNSLQSISTTSQGAGIMRGCTLLSSIVLPELQTIVDTVPNPNDGGTTYGCWNGCTGLISVLFPKLLSISCNYGTFAFCTSLTSVQFGSEGHPVTSLSGNVFRNCTQSNLIITIYTNGGAALSGSPWGATNATIVYEEA